jgi:hypothetical protein
VTAIFFLLLFFHIIVLHCFGEVFGFLVLVVSMVLLFSFDLFVCLFVIEFYQCLLLSPFVIGKNGGECCHMQW